MTYYAWIFLLEGGDTCIDNVILKNVNREMWIGVGWLLTNWSARFT